MEYKIQVLQEIIEEIKNDPYQSAKLKCKNGRTLGLGIEAITALIKYFETVTNCEICPDAVMCDQVKYDCPKWYE